MKNRYFIITLLALSLCFIETQAKKNQRPNIIVILSDDMGYSDLGCFGGDVQTPNLDALANDGLRLTQFYNAARCCPTRASLMTGLYPHQTGIGHMTNPPKESYHNYGFEQYAGDINDKSITIAQVLKSAGYTTLMTGKWHLGWDDKADWPLQRGFDKFYGCTSGATNYFKPEYPRGIMYMNEDITIEDSDFYTTDAFTDKAVDFIDKAQSENANKPFFLYLAYTAPHWPLNAPAKDIAKYKGHYLQGWSELRKQRFDNMKNMGIIDDSWELSQDDGVEWNSLSPEKKEEMDLRRAIYSAQIDRMDQNIGKLKSYLEENKLIDNTVIIFLNDNGACAEGGMLGGGPKSQLTTKEGYFLTYGKAWANSSNTPYREYKHWVHEGGISTPFIVSWPTGIPEKIHGKISSDPCFLPDLMATCINLANAEYPAVHQGNDITPHSGKSMVPLFKGKKARTHEEPIFWEHEGNKAVRLGDYKLVSKWNKNAESTWELYNIPLDRTEMNNLTFTKPELVKKMINLYDEWAKDTKVRPWNEIVEIRQEIKANSKK